MNGIPSYFVSVLPVCFCPTDPQDPTWNAFKRAAGKSFGSIALISLIIAIVKTLRYLSQQARRQASGAAAIVCLCVQCLVTMLLVRYS